MKKLFLVVLAHSAMLFCPGDFDVERYKNEDSQIAKKRAEENAELQKKYQEETATQAKIRNDQSFTERLLKSVTSDGDTDSDISKKRNAERLDINRQRLQEDLARQKARIEEFKVKHAEFAKKPAWETLLKLGDMKSFVDMKYDERKAFIEKIKSSVDSLKSDPSRVTPADAQALKDLIKLTTSNFESSDDSIEMENSSAKEFKNLHEANQIDLKNSLSSALQSALDSQIAALNDFNEKIHNLNEDIHSLKNTRLIKEISLKATMILGTVAAVFMFIHLPVEIPAIFTKVAFVIYHNSIHTEDVKAAAIQDKFLDSMNKLMPKTAELLKADVYKSEQDSLSKRIDDGINSSKLGDSGKALYKGFKDGIKSIGSGIGKATDFVKDNFNKAKVSLSESSLGKKLSSLVGSKKAVVNVSDVEFDEFNPLVQSKKSESPEPSVATQGENYLPAV